MKKVLALVLALVLMMSLSVVAFANVAIDPDKEYVLGLNDLGDDFEATPDKPGATYKFTIFVTYDLALKNDVVDMDNKFNKDIYDWALANKDPFGDLNAVWNEDDGQWQDEAGGEVATPKFAGTSARYFLVDDDEAKHLSVSLKERGDKIVKATSIIKEKGVYKVKVETNVSYDTKEREIDWTITLKRNKTKTVSETDVVLYTQKWDAVEGTPNRYDVVSYDVDLAKTTEGSAFNDEITTDENRKALATLAKGTYNELFFSDSDFWYSVDMKTKATYNFYHNFENKAMFKFFDGKTVDGIFFNGTPEIDYTGIFHASFDDDMFVYAVVDADGKLADVFEWNKDTECWEYKTKTLFGAIVSDEKLDIDAWNKTLEKDGSSEDGKDNPGTGSVDFVNIAVALGVVSLAAAGAVALKK